MSSFKQGFLEDSIVSEKSDLESPFLDEELFVDEDAGGSEDWAPRFSGNQLDSPFRDAFETEGEVIVKPKAQVVFEPEIEKFAKLDFEMDEEDETFNEGFSAGEDEEFLEGFGKEEDSSNELERLLTTEAGAGLGVFADELETLQEYDERELEDLDALITEEEGGGAVSGVSSVAIPSIKEWGKGYHRPRVWQGRVYGLVVHTSGSGVPRKARKEGISATAWTVRYYKRSRGCHYVNGWGGIEAGDLIQIANERVRAKGVGVTNKDDPRKDQSLSIRQGRFEKDLPPILVKLWRKRWPERQNSLELLPGTKSANWAFMHVECPPCVFWDDGRQTGATPMRPGLRFTRAQHDSVAHLAVDVARRNGWPTDAEWWRTPRLLGHEDLTPISRHDKKGGWDPGYLREQPYFDWDYVYETIERILKHPSSASASTNVFPPISSVFFVLGAVARRFQEMIAGGQESLAVAAAYQQGVTDKNKLTNLVFFARHPELGGRQIRRDEHKLAREWRDIQNNVVHPALQQLSNREASPAVRSEQSLSWEMEEDVELGEAFLDEEPEGDEAVENDFFESGASTAVLDEHPLDWGMAKEQEIFEPEIEDSAALAAELDEVGVGEDEAEASALAETLEDLDLDDEEAKEEFDDQTEDESEEYFDDELVTLDTGLEAADALEQFIGTEHRDIGNLAAGREATTIVYGERGKRLTFGELVALAGDHFATYNEMVKQTRTAAGRAKIAWARWYALDLKNKKVPEPKTDSNFVMERYYVLASRNWSHFSAGGKAWKTYVRWHSRAIADAFQAGQEGSESVWRRALTKEAFGDHFLTDMFSAGHVRVPRIAIRDWYAKHIPGDRLLRYMAKFLYDRLPLPWYAHIFSGRAKDRIKNNIVKIGGAAIRTVSVGDIVSVALHDYDGRGLRVLSDVNADGKKIPGGFHWLAVGDGRLGKSSGGSTTKMMATDAVITSLRDLELVRGVGRKLAGRQLSTSQKSDAVRQALSGNVFAARPFVPREDPAPGNNGANVPLPGSNSSKSPLEWRWGKLGDITYQIVDEAVKTKIAKELSDRLPSVQDKNQRRVLGLFADHLRSEGIQAIEKAVGKKAR